jgi:hypothetical protein
MSEGSSTGTRSWSVGHFRLLDQSFIDRMSQIFRLSRNFTARSDTLDLSVSHHQTYRHNADTKHISPCQQEVAKQNSHGPIKIGEGQQTVPYSDLEDHRGKKVSLGHPCSLTSTSKEGKSPVCRMDEAVITCILPTVFVRSANGGKRKLFRILFGT